MKQYAVYLSDRTYRLLVQQATIEQISREQVIERLLLQGVTHMNETRNVRPHDVDSALAAVHRLTNLFADAKIAELEQTLADPMLEMTNAGLDMAL